MARPMAVYQAVARGSNFRVQRETLLAQIGLYVIHGLNHGGRPGRKSSYFMSN